MSTFKYPLLPKIAINEYPHMVTAKDTWDQWKWINENCPNSAKLLVGKSTFGSNGKFGFKYQEDAVAFKLKFGINS